MEIILNVYDLSSYNYYLTPIGLGAYHSGVQIGYTEYYFGYHPGNFSGIAEQTPRQPLENGMKLYRSIVIGKTSRSKYEIDNIIDEMSKRYVGKSYDVLAQNCNHFANELCFRMVGKQIPAYINRLAYIGNSIRCLIPRKLLANNPNQKNDTSANSNAYNNNNNYSGQNNQIPTADNDDQEMQDLQQQQQKKLFSGKAVKLSDI